jgi:hypothetical protein
LSLVETVKSAATTIRHHDDNITTNHHTTNFQRSMPDKASYLKPRALPPRPQYNTPVAASQPDIHSVRIERLTLIEMNTPSFFQTHPRVCALILATTKGSRLFPMTSTDNPKHMLPIAGIPSILRLVERLAYLPQLVVAISAEDSTTLPRLKTELGGNDPTEVIEESNPTVISVKGRSQQLIVLKLSPDCFGTVDALREVEETKIVHRSSRLVVFPGDLVFLQKEVNLDPLLRPPSDSDCAILLVDVGEVDEHGIPLKESAKVSPLLALAKSDLSSGLILILPFHFRQTLGKEGWTSQR